MFHAGTGSSTSMPIIGRVSADWIRTAARSTVLVVADMLLLLDRVFRQIDVPQPDRARARIAPVSVTGRTPVGRVSSRRVPPPGLAPPLVATPPRSSGSR